MGPNPNDYVLLGRGHLDTDAHRWRMMWRHRETYVKGTAETGSVTPQAKDRLGCQRRKEAREDILREVSEETWPCSCLDLGLLASRAVIYFGLLASRAEIIYSCCSKPPASWRFVTTAPVNECSRRDTSPGLLLPGSSTVRPKSELWTPVGKAAGLPWATALPFKSWEPGELPCFSWTLSPSSLVFLPHLSN